VFNLVPLEIDKGKLGDGGIDYDARTMGPNNHMGVKTMGGKLEQ